MSLPQLTPDNLRNIHIWHDALISGKYRELAPELRDNYYKDGCHCAAGVAFEANGYRCGTRDNGHGAPDIWICLIIPEHINSVIMGFFMRPPHPSFRDAAALLADYMLENYCVDLAAPETAPAPSPESEVKHVR